VSRLRILHLEDNPLDTTLVEATLADDGLDADVVRVDNRAAFEAALDSGDVDVILADYNLPAFDGVSAQVTAAHVRPDTPFIFLSGSIGEERAIDRLRAGATDYVLKDRMARLPSAIRRALAEAAAHVERRRAEADVRRLNAELEHRVIERTAQLAAARLEAERANRAKSAFLSNMSHDLRTPLNAILGFAQLLELDEVSDDHRECVAQILRGGTHLLALINEVLDIARIEAGHLSLSMEPVDAVETAELAVELVRPLAAQRGIEIAIDGPAAGAVVLADRQRLSQVLINLLSNAVKYNRPQGRITVAFAAAGPERMRLAVTDTGAGISSEKLRLLFQPFARLGAEHTAVEGTGLGLALSRGLAEAMGGTLGVDSVIDRGSTFWIELACAKALQPHAAVENAPAARLDPARAQGVLLYIEDNQSNVRLMQRVLERRPGVRLVHAPHGEAGLALASAERPDLIFLDLHLPDMPGEEVLRRLTADATLRAIPVAVLSADATPAQSRRLKASGAVAYLTKPIEIRDVIAMVDERLAGARER
jgi:signal transduction histidine kinase/ActR/RegA family two-component response regulator